MDCRRTAGLASLLLAVSILTGCCCPCKPAAPKDAAAPELLESTRYARPGFVVYEGDCGFGEGLWVFRVGSADLEEFRRNGGAGVRFGAFVEEGGPGGLSVCSGDGDTIYAYLRSFGQD